MVTSAKVDVKNEWMEQVNPYKLYENIDMYDVEGLKKLLENKPPFKRKDGTEIVDYFGKNNPNCFALHLYDVTEFEEYLTLKDMRKVSNNADMPQYIKFIYENDPLYDVITKWDEAFSLDGNLCENPTKTKQLILQNAMMKGRK